MTSDSSKTNAQLIAELQIARQTIKALNEPNECAQANDEKHELLTEKNFIDTALDAQMETAIYCW